MKKTVIPSREYLEELTELMSVLVRKEYFSSKEYAKRARLLTIGTQLLECKINLPVKINFVHILFGCKINTFTGRLQYAIADGYTSGVA